MDERISPLHELLMTACHEGDLLTVRKLLRKKSELNVNAVDRIPSGESALAKASRGGHVEICKLLLDAGADVNVFDALRVSPLHLAARGGHIEVVKLLLIRGADPRMKTYNNMFPINFCSYNSEIRLVIKQACEGRLPTQEVEKDVVPLVPASAIVAAKLTKKTRSKKRKINKTKRKRVF